MRSKKVRAAMIAAAACLSFTSVVAPSATALAAGYTGHCAGGKRKLVLLQQRTESDKRYKSGTE